MRKLFVLGFILFCVHYSVNAQINLKPHLGANYTSFSTDPQFYTQENAVGSVVGLGVQLGGRFYIEPALQWKNARIKLVPDPTNQTGDIEIDFRGFRIPVMAGFRLLGTGDGLNIRVFAGPSVMINTSSEVNSNLPEISSESLSNAQWAANAGLGVDFIFLYMELCYEAGLSDTFKEDLQNWNNPSANYFYLTLGANL
jgi:hypothetical protein